MQATTPPSGDDSAHSKKRKLETAADCSSADSSPDAASDSALSQQKQRLQHMLEPFSREQLIQVLISAATQHDDVYNEILAAANADVTHRKVFVRGLAWATSSERLGEVFARFGQVEEAAVIFDKATGKSRGFGFVTFVDMEAAERAIGQRSIDIDGRTTSCNLAAMRSGSEEPHAASVGLTRQSHSNQQVAQPQNMPPPTSPAYAFYPTPMQPPPYVVQADTSATAMAGSAYPQDAGSDADRKLFVRGLAWETTDDTLHAEFVRFGELVEASVVRDRSTGKSKGFGFVTFRRRESAMQALQCPQKTIDGRSTTCNLASQGSRRTTSSAPMIPMQSMANPVPPVQVGAYQPMPVAYTHPVQPMAQPPMPAGSAYSVYAVPPAGQYPQQYAYAAAPPSASYIPPPAPPQ